MSNFVFQDENESFRPRLVSSNAHSQRREIAASVLPKGANLFPKNAGGFFSSNMPMGMSPVGGGGGGSASYHMQRPYFPGTESPDRVQYPKSRAEANKAWRLFNESDPILGTAIDMYSEMLVSDFDLVVGDEKSREIRDTLEYMCQVSKLQETLRYIIKEFLVMGEAFPHNFFDDKLGIWTYTAFHDPDNVDVLDSSMINADPILSLTPDEDLRQLMVDNSPEARELRSRLPQEFVSKILARQRIRLSPLNCTFIPRKLHPYQTRGTSLVSRMWRIFMVEDAVYNSTIATFRRHASPVKVVKLGNAATGWMPGPGAETKVLEMLNRAETDPHCFLPWVRVTLADGSVKQIQELSVGEKLLDRDGKVCEVLVLQPETTESYLRFWVEGERWSIDCTPTHKFDVWNGTSIVKLPASEIQEGQYFRIPRYFEEVTPSFPCDRKLILEQCFENKSGGDSVVCRDENLKLTSQAMQWPLTYKRIILDYLFSEEFNGSSGIEFGLTTCSSDLYWQVKLIQAQLGERSFCDVEHLGGKTYFNVQLPDPVRKPDFFVTDEYVFARIFDIGIENRSETVFNMTVSGDHSYCVQHYGTYNSWLVYNYGIEFEAWGTTDRAISISKEHEVIERVKLLALGLSKSFMTGEVTYASAKSGLQVFLRRLLSLRQFLENIWLYPKFFRPISEINEWTTSSPSEINHKYRLKRTAQEIQEQNLILMPTIKWKNKLDPSVDQDLLNAYQMLEKMGVKLSKATISSAVGVDWQDELDLSLKEYKTTEKMKEDLLGQAMMDKYNKAQGQGQAAPPAPPGGPGGGAKPPGAAGPGGAKPSGGMDDASKPPGSGASPGGGIDPIQAPSGGGLPTGVE